MDHFHITAGNSLHTFRYVVNKTCAIKSDCAQAYIWSRDVITWFWFCDSALCLWVVLNTRWVSCGQTGSDVLWISGWSLESRLHRPTLSSYLKEAAAPVCEAARGIPGHVVFLSAGPGSAHVWVCVYVWGSVCTGRSSAGQKHTSAVAQPEEIPSLATASIMEALVC